MGNACTFCGRAASDVAFVAQAPASTAAICNICLAVNFRRIEKRKGLVPSPGVAHMIGAVEMWPLERRLRQVNHAYSQGRAKLRTKLREILRGPSATRPATQLPVAAMFVQRVHPLGTFEKQCALCKAREQLIPSPKGARICEPCVESWARTLLG